MNYTKSLVILEDEALAHISDALEEAEGKSLEVVHEDLPETMNIYLEGDDILMKDNDEGEYLMDMPSEIICLIADNV